MSTPTPDPNQNPAAQVAASQAQQPAAPAAAGQPPVAPALVAAPATPATPTPTPYATARTMNVPASPHNDQVAMFDKILRMVNPGTSYVDAQGNTQVDQSRPTLGRSILAGALTGLLTPTRYREGAYGPVVSGDQGAADAFQSGRNQQTSVNSALEKASQDAQTKKLSVIANNIQTAHAYAALAMDQHKFLDETATANQNAVLKDISAYDAEQIDPANKLLVGSGLTFDRALAQMKGKLTSQNMIIDGSTTQMDPETGQYIVKPTYSIVNPDAKINMSEDAAAMLKKYIPAYANAYDLTAGEIKIPVSKYLADMNTYHSFQHAENYLSRADEDLGIKPGDLAAAVRNNRSLITPIRDAENAVAQGGTVADYLDRLRKSPGGLDVLKAVGLGDPNVVNKYIQDFRNKQAADTAKATAGIKEEAKIESVSSDNDAQAVLANPKKYPADVVTAAKTWMTNKKNTEVDTEQRKVQNAETLANSKQDQKDKNQMVYAEDKDGNIVYTTKYDAENVLNASPSSIREVKPSDVKADTSAIRMLNDVQANVSRYTKAATDYSQAQLTFQGKPVSAQNPVPDTTLGVNTSPITTSDALRERDNAHLHTLLNKAGIADINAAISAGGHIEVPVLSSFGERLTRGINSKDYNELSDQGKALYDGYIRTMSAVPAYQKALTGIGRSNKEMLDLELANIANPTMAPGDILRKQKAFQENVDRASEGFPKLPGVKRPQDLRKEAESQSAQPQQTQPTQQQPQGVTRLYDPKTKQLITLPFSLKPVTPTGAQ
jgi:hypothetical protein